MAATAKRKSGNKKASRKGTTTKRVQEERANAFRRGVNTVLVLVLVLLVLFGFYQAWNLLGKPGWPSARPGHRYVCVEIYFYDTSVTYLVPVQRQLTLARSENRTARAIKEFAAGPNDPQLGRVYPANIPEPSVTVRDRVAIVDLPPQIKEHFGGTSREKTLLDAITLTVEAAGECETTRILIDGEVVETTPEGYILSEPLSPPEFFNHVPDSSLEGESKWVTANFLDSTGHYLIPLAIEVGPDAVEANEAVERMLDHPPQLAYPPPSPVCESGYTLTRVTIESGVGSVDISVPDSQTAFMNTDINLFRHALFLTLKKCCLVRDIDLMINGRSISTYARFADLPAVNDNECWNLERTPNAPEPVEISVWGVEM